MIMGKKLLFIYNANAGMGKIRPSLSKVIERLCQVGYDVTIYATQAAGEARDIVTRRGESVEVVVCSGGDGTINEVIAGAMRLDKKPRIGYLPTGTMNDFAKSLGIPGHPLKAVETVVAGQAYSCDIGSFNGRNFNYVAAFGAFTEVSYQTPQRNKNALGKMAYFVDAIGRLPKLRGYHLRAKADSRYIEGDFIYGMISNSKSVGGFMLEDKKHKISLCDGKFELILLKNPQNPIEFEQVIQCALTHNIDGNNLLALKASNIEIKMDEPVSWTLDGENGGTWETANIFCRKGAIDIFAGNMGRKKKIG